MKELGKREASHTLAAKAKVQVNFNKLFFLFYGNSDAFSVLCSMNDPAFLPREERA